MAIKEGPSDWTLYVVFAGFLALFTYVYWDIFRSTEEPPSRPAVSEERGEPLMR